MRTSIQIAWDDRTRPIASAWLTDQHAASSHGIPVVVARASETDPTLVPWGPADLTLAGGAVVVTPDPEAFARAEAAGYRVAVDFNDPVLRAPRLDAGIL